MNNTTPTTSPNFALCDIQPPPPISTADWSFQDFGKVQLGHGARNKRARLVAHGALCAPAGPITHVFKTEAERHGAYRWLNNDAVSVTALLDSMAKGAQSRLIDTDDIMIISSDMTSLSFNDPSKRKQLGPTGNRRHQRGRGLIAMGSLLQDNTGVPVGIVDLQFWTRPDKPPRCHRRKATSAERHAGRMLPFEKKETYYWKLTAQRCIERLELEDWRAWFQWDRGADAHEVLDFIEESNQFFTLRLCQDRSVNGNCSELFKTIKPVLALQKVKARCTVEIPRSGHQKGRRAHLEVRFATVNIPLKVASGKIYNLLEMQVVWCREVGASADVDNALNWYLLTNRQVETVGQALEVIEKYTLRWRSEDFHRSLKTSIGIENSELRSQNALERWVCILGSVAVRAEHLKHASRADSEQSALKELSEQELEALVSLAKPRDYQPGREVTLGQAVRWLALLGGYSPSRKPPGTEVITRGLLYIQPLAELLHDHQLVPRKTGQ